MEKMEYEEARASEDQDRQHSRYEESRISHQIVHDITLADFEHRLARGESRDGLKAKDEFIHFDLGTRRIRLQAKVRHNGDGMDEGNLVTITVDNKTADGSKVYLAASLSYLDSNDQNIHLAKKDNVALEEGKRLTLFAFKATDAPKYCCHGDLRLKLEVS